MSVTMAMARMGRATRTSRGATEPPALRRQLQDGDDGDGQDGQGPQDLEEREAPAHRATRWVVTRPVRRSTVTTNSRGPVVSTRTRAPLDMPCGWNTIADGVVALSTRSAAANARRAGGV